MAPCNCPCGNCFGCFGLAYTLAGCACVYKLFGRICAPCCGGSNQDDRRASTDAPIGNLPSLVMVVPASDAGAGHEAPASASMARAEWCAVPSE